MDRELEDDKDDNIMERELEDNIEDKNMKREVKEGNNITGRSFNPRNVQVESCKLETCDHTQKNYMIVKVYSWCALVTKASCRQQDVKVHSLRLHPDHRLDKGQCFIVMCTGISISMYIFEQMVRIVFIWLSLFLSV